MQLINDSLIEKYLKGLCTSEEATVVLQFLRENPEHPYLLKEWKATDAGTALPENYTQQMFDEVDAVINRPAGKIFFVWKYAAAAACVAGVIISLLVINKNQTAQATVAAVQTVQATIWSVQHNYGQNDTAMLMADGSILTLSPNASIRYRADFNGYNKREIFMTGRVFFEVAKNKQKPFTVYSHNLGTTALGTAFYVDAPENASKLSVQLLEGKVVVALTDKRNTPPGNYYLVPGQELVFNVNTGKGRITVFTAKSNTRKTFKQRKLVTLPQRADASYMFNNQTLAEVLDQLSVMYKADIQYSKATIGNMYFIGRIDRSDPLDKIINDIALLNKLSVKKQNGTYILTKKQ